MAITRITKGVIKPNENYDTHNINSTGIVTAIGLDVNGNADVSGSLSVGGVLTYEDVTSIDSVGIITARTGLVSPYADIDDFVSIGNNIHLGNAGVVTATSFVGDGSGLIGVASTDNIITGTAATFNTYPVDINAGMTVAGVSTFQNNVHLLDNDYLYIGGSVGTTDGMRLYHNGNNSFIRNTNKTLYIGQEPSSSEFPLYVHAGDEFYLKHYHANGGQNSVIKSIRGGAFTLYHGAGNVPASGTERLVTTSTGINFPRDIDVDGHTNLDNLNIAGVSTFAGTLNASTVSSTALIASGDLDVDGHTNLDNVSVAGIVTITNSSSGVGLKLIDASSKQFVAGGGGGGSPFAGSFTGHDFRIQVGGLQNAIFKYASGATGNLELGPSSGIGITFNGATGNAGYAGIVTASTYYGDGSNLSNITSTTINNNANNRIITGSDTANTLNGEANLTLGNNLQFTTTANGHSVILKSTGNYYNKLSMDSNVTSANAFLNIIDFSWDGDKVADIVAVSGSDTTNKDDGHLVFRTSASQGSITERLRIPSGGGLAIGTASPTRTPLHVHEPTTATANIHLTNSSSGSGSTDGLTLFLDSTPTAGVWFREAGALRFGTNNTDRLRIEADGDIGLGTNSPNRSGYGAPVVSIGYNTSNNYSVLELQGNKTSDATVATIVGYNVGGTSRIAEISMGRDTGNNSGVISFLTYDGGSGNERTRIDHDGRLLHGNASNTGVAGHGVRIQSDAVGSNYATGALALRGTGGDFYAITMLGDSGNAWGMLPIFSAGTDYLSFGYYDGPNSSNSGALFRIEEGGNVIAAGTVDSASDIKLKTNIKTIDNALDKVLQLRGTEYDRIDRNNQHEIGVIAQEVEKIIPELVNTNEDPDGEKTKTVSYGNMVAVLIEAIKEQNDVINKMKKEIEDLKG